MHARVTFADALDSGAFVVTAELTPPTDADPAPQLADATRLATCGVHAVTVSDHAMARRRMGSIALAHLLQQHAGVDAVPHLTCRDRNLLALEGDLLGAHALGLRSVLCVTGDPPHLGDRPTATRVADLDSIGLLALVRELGTRDGATLRAGAVCAPAADDLQAELDRLARKVDAGASFVVTQPQFDPDLLTGFLDRAAPLGVPVLVGVLALRSAQQATFLHERVPGIHLPGDDPAAAVGIAPAQAIVEIARAHAHAHGIHLLDVAGRVDELAPLLG